MKPLLTASWTDLAVVTYQVDAQALQPWLPHKTELDSWNGNYYMSLVAFLFSSPVIAGIPSPVYRHFPEINLRFYIRFKKENEWVKAVVFIREIAPAWLIGFAAKLLYNENFTNMQMKYHKILKGQIQQAAYHWKTKKEWNWLELSAATSPVEPMAESLEFFTKNNYTACTKNGINKTKVFTIDHPNWQVYPGLTLNLSIDAENIYGPQLAPYFKQKPSSIYLMDGSRTNVSYPSLL
jgi:uncharacterized protein